MCSLPRSLSAEATCRTHCASPPYRTPYARQVACRALSPRHDVVHMWALRVGTFLPQTGSAAGGLPRMGSVIEGVVHGEHGRRGVAHEERDKGVILDARVLDLLFRSIFFYFAK